MMKSHMFFSFEDGWSCGTPECSSLREHIFAEHQQQSKIPHLKANLKSNACRLQGELQK